MQSRNLKPADLNKVSFWDDKVYNATAFYQKLNFISESQYIKHRNPFNQNVQLAPCIVIKKGLLRTANPFYVGRMAQLSGISFVNYLMVSGHCSHSSRWHYALVCQCLLSKYVTPGDPLTRLLMNIHFKTKTKNLIWDSKAQATESCNK